MFSDGADSLGCELAGRGFKANYSSAWGLVVDRRF